MSVLLPEHTGTSHTRLSTFQLHDSHTFLSDSVDVPVFDFTDFYKGSVTLLTKDTKHVLKCTYSSLPCSIIAHFQGIWSEFVTQATPLIYEELFR